MKTTSPPLNAFSLEPTVAGGLVGDRDLATLTIEDDGGRLAFEPAELSLRTLHGAPGHVVRAAVLGSDALALTLTFPL